MPPGSTAPAHYHSLPGYNFTRKKSTTQPKLLISPRSPKRLLRKPQKSDRYSGERPKMLNKDNGHPFRGNKTKSAANLNTGHKDSIIEQNNKSEQTSDEIKNVPNPVPNTGSRPTQAQIPGYPPNPTVSPDLGSSLHLSTISTTLAIVPHTFSALPPLLSSSFSMAVISTSPPTTEIFTSVHSDWESGNNIGKTSGQHQIIQPHKLPTFIIVLLAVGSGLLLAGLFIVIKFCSRPARRPRLVPSLPILDDPFSDDGHLQPKESPVFGGKERFSSQPGSSNGLWTWTQYPQPGLGKNTQVLNHSQNTGDNPYIYDKAQYPSTSQIHTQSALVQTLRKSPCQLPAKKIENTLAYDGKRESAASMSLYPMSPQTRYSHVNIPIDGHEQRISMTASGYNTMKQTKSKNESGRTRTYSTNGGASEHVLKLNRYSQATAYDGADIASPTFLSYTIPQPDSIPSRGGRTKIKSSYYTPGAIPRISDLPSTTSRANIDKSYISGGHEHQTTIRKSDSRRDRDTQALTYALGISSPTVEHVVSSPQPTIYPDDSLSVVDGRVPRKHSVKRSASKNKVSAEDDSSPVITTAQDATAALGSLMLVDFDGSGQQTLNPTQKLAGNMVVSSSSSKLVNDALKKSHPRNDDKAPSIPLPPPLPSLAQMGLEHANPQAYADYRSPTYSIYGLYQSERKSGFEY